MLTFSYIYFSINILRIEP